MTSGAREGLAAGWQRPARSGQSSLSRRQCTHHILNRILWVAVGPSEGRPRYLAVGGGGNCLAASPASGLDGPVAWSSKDADEALACLVLGTVLGTRVECVDKSPLQGHHDLEVYYSDGGIDAGEVVSTRDPQWMRLIHSLPRRSYTECAGLTRMWFVLVKPTASLKDLDILSLLRDLECERIDRISDLGYGSMELMLRKVGIETCSSTVPTEMHPPGFFLMPKVMTGMVGDGDYVMQFCQMLLATELGRSKEVDKLRRAEMASERHLVIILTADQLGPHTAVHTGEMPTQPPDLPQGVDWLWVIGAEWSVTTRAIYWSPAGQWSEVVVG